MWKHSACGAEISQLSWFIALVGKRWWSSKILAELCSVLLPRKDGTQAAVWPIESIPISILQCFSGGVSWVRVLEITWCEQQLLNASIFNHCAMVCHEWSERCAAWVKGRGYKCPWALSVGLVSCQEIDSDNLCNLSVCCEMKKRLKITDIKLPLGSHDLGVYDVAKGWISFFPPLV